MTDGLLFMLPAMTACVVLAGIHCYLGLHVVARQVYFADLALAQMAALGGAIGLVQGRDLGTLPSYGWSLLMTMVGAAVFAWSRRLDRRVSPEAVIGLTYVVSVALTLLVMDRAPEGPDQLKALLVGSLLLTDWPTIGVAALLYAVIGLFFWRFRRVFELISFDPARARRQGILVPRWDFAFFAIFGLVVTSSVRIAGVMVVFTLLVAPAVVAAALARDPGRRLVIGWVVGVVLAAAGVAVSYTADLSTGSAVVATIGGALAVAGLLARPAPPGPTVRSARRSK